MGRIAVKSGAECPRNPRGRSPSMEARMRNRGRQMARWTCSAIVLGLIATGVQAQSPAISAIPAAARDRRGPLHRFFHHTAHTLEDKFIGYPDTFMEPPLGFYIREQFAVQVAKADPHRFTLYR